MKKLITAILIFATTAGYSYDFPTWDGDCDIEIPWKESKFDSHFSSVEIGFNTFVNNDFQMELPDDYSFLELHTGKSWGVNLNVAEVNFSIVENILGLTTGLKFQFNNYRFDNNITLNQDSTVVWYTEETNVTYSKTKLTNTYLLVPIMVEVQMPKDSKLHLAVGAEAGMKIGSHTKTVYKDNGEKIKDKDRKDFYLSPFRYNAVAKIGYEDISVFMNYSLESMFENDRGPELYPLMVGIAFNF
jgi:outer membrane protein with beta-barrel domain